MVGVAHTHYYHITLSSIIINSEAEGFPKLLTPNS